MSEDLTSKTASELAALIRCRKTSAVEVMQAHLEIIDKLNPSINAIVTVADDALDQARAADQMLGSRPEPGPLHGVPITVKDTIDTRGVRTTCGSRLRADFVPQRDASVVERLRAAGAIILGKTNTPEMAIPYETDNPVFGRTNNPHDLSRTPGGSSGGEAAAIAAHMSPAGIGSDLSGSIRVPAHFCGVAGLKPTTGLVPMDGHVPEATGALSIGACIGPMARRVVDLALLFSVIAQTPETDLTGARSELGGLKVAWFTGDGAGGVTAETTSAVKQAAEVLAEAGLEVIDECPPGIRHGSRLWVELFSRPAQTQLQDFYRGREGEAGPLVEALLRKGDQPGNVEDKIKLAEETAKAVVEREHLRENLLRWMKSRPLILAPVAAMPAFTHGAHRVDIEGESVSIFRACRYAQAFNVFGLPVAVVPVTRDSHGLPIGVQIVGGPFEELRVLQAAAIVEESISFM